MYRRVHFARFVGPRRGRRRRRGRPRRGSHRLARRARWLDRGDLHQELQATQALRKAGLSAELYPEAAKLKKQFKYANDRKVRWVLIFGESELAAGTVMVKDMQEGEQEALSLEKAVEKIQASASS